MEVTHDACVVGGTDVRVAELGPLQLQSGVHHPQRCRYQDIHNSCVVKGGKKGTVLAESRF